LKAHKFTYFFFQTFIRVRRKLLKESRKIKKFATLGKNGVAFILNFHPELQKNLIYSLFYIFLGHFYSPGSGFQGPQCIRIRNSGFNFSKSLPNVAELFTHQFIHIPLASRMFGYC
jgi:hypothetical protein